MGYLLQLVAAVHAYECGHPHGTHDSMMGVLTVSASKASYRDVGSTCHMSVT